MNDQVGPTPMSFERALSDPAGVFASPEEVLTDTHLTQLEKVEVLRRWAHDADRLAASEYEGMVGGEPARQGRVLEALTALEAQVAADPEAAGGGAGTSNRLDCQ